MTIMPFIAVLGQALEEEPVRRMMSTLSVAVISIYLTACAAHQPIKRIVQHHPTEYKNYLSRDGYRSP